MQYSEQRRVEVVTDASGDATAYVDVPFGFVAAIAYTKAGVDGYATGVDFTITGERTGETIWTEANVDASKLCRPRVLVQDTAGADLTDVYEPVLLVNDRIKIVIANGGDSKTGTFDVVVG